MTYFFALNSLSSTLLASTASAGALTHAFLGFPRYDALEAWDPSQFHQLTAHNGEVGSGGVFRQSPREQVMRRMQGSLETILAEHYSTKVRVEALTIYYEQSLLLPPNSTEFAQAIEQLLGIFDSFETSPDAEFLKTHFDLGWIKLLGRLPADARENSYSKALMQLIRGPWLPLIEPRLVSVTDEHNVADGDVYTYYENEDGLYQDIHRPRQLRVRRILELSDKKIPWSSVLQSQSLGLIAFLDREACSPPMNVEKAFLLVPMGGGLITVVLGQLAEMILPGLFPPEVSALMFIGSFVGLSVGALVRSKVRWHFFIKPLQERWDQVLEGFEALDFEQWNKTLDAMVADSDTKTGVRAPTAKADTEDAEEEIAETNEADDKIRRRRS